MSIIDFYAPTKKRIIAISVLIALFLVCIFITYISTPPCQGDMCYGPNTLGTFTWIIAMILAIGFLLIGYTFAYVLNNNLFGLRHDMFLGEFVGVILMIIGAIISLFIWYTIICLIFRKKK